MLHIGASVKNHSRKANDVDFDETAHNEPSHQDLHCLQKYLSWSSGLKGLIFLFLTMFQSQNFVQVSYLTANWFDCIMTIVRVSLGFLQSVCALHFIICSLCNEFLLILTAAGDISIFPSFQRKRFATILYCT